MRATQGRQEAVRARTGARVRQIGHATSRQGADVLMSRTYLDEHNAARIPAGAPPVPARPGPR
jgi:hypothetical protein